MQANAPIPFTMPAVMMLAAQIARLGLALADYSPGSAVHLLVVNNAVLSLNKMLITAQRLGDLGARGTKFRRREGSNGGCRPIPSPAD